MRNSLNAIALRRVLQDDSGATAIEYALIAGGISIAILVGLTTLGTKVTGIYATLASLF